MRFVILAIVFGLVGWTMARSIRDRVSRSPARRHLLIRASVALILGLVVALWLPRRVPQTQGSPALILVGVTTIIGALLARNPADGPPELPAP